MDVINPWSIGIGVAAISAPIMIHFFTRPRPITCSLSTIRFVREVIEQRRARSRLRDLLLLLLRMGCIGLVSLAVARPLLSRRPVVPVNAARDSQRVIVLDVSQSMSAGSGGVTRWSAAVASTLKYLDSTSNLQANVVFCGAKPTPVFDRMSANLNALREAVKQAAPRAEQAHPRAALEVAANLLSQGASQHKELVIVSDFQRTNWGTLLLDLVPNDTRVQLHSVAPKLTDNVGVTGVHFSAEPVVGQPVTMEIEISNHSDREVTSHAVVELETVERRFDVTLPPQSTRTFTEVLSFDDVGWKRGWVRLEGQLDVLTEDDERPVALRVRPPVRVLLVTRQNAQDVPSSSFYLQQALNVALTSAAAASASDQPAGPSDKLANDAVQRVHPSRDSWRNWPACDVFVFDHAGALSDEIQQFVGAQVRRGKGMLYVTSELVDGINMKQLAHVLGSDFQPPVEFIPTTNPTQRRDLFVRQVRSRESPFQVLGSNQAAALFRPVRFQGGLNTKATAEGLRDQVLAELSDTSALLFLSSVGAGQIAVLNADLNQSNWTVQPTFLPIVSELIQSLLASKNLREPTASGEPLVRVLPTTITDVNRLSAKTLAGPEPNDGDFGQWQWVASQNAVVWNWASPPGAGIYSLEQDNAAVWMVATSIPAVESALESLDEQVLTGRLSGDRAVGYAAAATEQRQDDNVWSWLTVACCCGLIAEAVALRATRM